MNVVAFKTPRDENCEKLLAVFNRAFPEMKLESLDDETSLSDIGIEIHDFVFSESLLPDIAITFNILSGFMDGLDVEKAENLTVGDVLDAIEEPKYSKGPA